MVKFKLAKTTAAITLIGASLVTGAIQDENDASAASKYKISYGKLVSTKTGKTVKGYVIYKSKLYYNGKLKKGYKTAHKGSIDKYYLFYNGKLKKGYKTAGNGERLYKDGRLDKGYEVYGDVAKNPTLYYNGKLKAGYKTAHKGSIDKYYLFYNGKLKKGYKTAGNGERLYKDGRLDKGYEVYGDVAKNPTLYYNGKLKAGYKTANNGELLFHNGHLDGGHTDDGYTTVDGTHLYKYGRPNEGRHLYESDQEVDNLNEDEFNDLLFDGLELAKGLIKVGNTFYYNGKRADGMFQYEGKEIFIDYGKVYEDHELPIALSAEALNTNTIRILFDEPLNPDTVNTDNFKIDLGTGEVPVSTVNLVNSKEVEINLDKNIALNPVVSASVIYHDVADTLGNKTPSEHTIKIPSIEDTIPPNYTASSYKTTSTNYQLTISFNEAIQISTLQDKANYTVGGKLLSTIKGASITTSEDTKSVTITVPKNTVKLTNGSLSFKLGGLKDQSGNNLSSSDLENSKLARAFTLNPNFRDVIDVNIKKSVEFTNKKTVKVPIKSGYSVQSVDVNKIDFDYLGSEGSEKYFVKYGVKAKSAKIKREDDGSTYIEIVLDRTPHVDFGESGIDIHFRKDAILLSDGALVEEDARFGISPQYAPSLILPKTGELEVDAVTNRVILPFDNEFVDDLELSDFIVTDEEGVRVPVLSGFGKYTSNYILVLGGTVNAQKLTVKYAGSKDVPGFTAKAAPIIRGSAEVTNARELDQAITKHMQTINILNDFTIEEEPIVSYVKDLKINGNGHTLTLSSITFPDGKEYNFGNLIFGANATVKDLTLTNTNETLKKNLIEVFKGANVTLEDVALKGSNRAGLSVQEGSNVTLKGNIVLSDNTLGGIEVENEQNANVEFAENATLSYTPGSNENAPVVFIDANTASPETFVTDHAGILSEPVKVNKAGEDITKSKDDKTPVQVWYYQK